MAEAQGRSRLERTHDALVVALITLRPLIWSGDGTAWDSLAYQWLVAIAGLSLVLEAWLGWRTSWRWSAAGIAALVLWLALLPAACQAPMPSSAWGLWGMLGIDLVLALYLMQVLPGRLHLAWGAFIAGLALEALIAFLQQAWVLPGMRAALAAGDAQLVRLENSHSDLAERLANGRVFGTFTLANALAAYLLLSLPPLLAALVRPGARWPSRALAALVAVAGLAAAGATASKGACAALVLAGAAVALGALRGRSRWLALGALALGAGLASAHLRSSLFASTDVRLGYWQGALTLIGEAPLLGHGLGGFAYQSARAMPIWAEPSRYVHCELLEAWSDGGLCAALALLILFVLLVRSVRLAPDERLEEEAGLRPLTAALPLVVIIPFLCAVGMLESNLSWWDGARSDAGWMAWVITLAGIAVGVVALAARLPLPPPWAWRIALGAFALHCLIDFDLHSPGLWGTLTIACCMAGGPARWWTLSRPRLLSVTLAAAALLIALSFGMQRALQLGQGDVISALAADCRAAVAAGRDASAPLAELQDRLGSPPAPDSDRTAGAAVIALATAQLDTIAETWPACYELAIASVALSPPGSERLAASQHLVGRWALSGPAHALVAQDLAGSGIYTQAIEEMQVAVRLAPADLNRRGQLVHLLDQAADHQAGHAIELHRRAQQERDLLTRLLRIVNPRNLP
jgi:hypothetical protein